MEAAWIGLFGTAIGDVIGLLGPWLLQRAAAAGWRGTVADRQIVLGQRQDRVALERGRGMTRLKLAIIAAAVIAAWWCWWSLLTATQSKHLPRAPLMLYSEIG
jgi:hypothetical protein